MGLELLEQLENVDLVIIPIGGGGLASGTAIALKERHPKCKVIGVQAETCPHTAEAWKGESKVPIARGAPPTIADGIAVKQVSDRIIPMLKKYVDDIVTVTEEEIASAVLSLLESSKVLAEGAAAAAFAPVMAGKIGNPRGNVIAVISGGNIDVNLISRIIEKGLIKTGRLVRLHVLVPDRPGGLRGLAQLFTEKRANIFQIEHNRASGNIPLSTTGTDLTLETRGPDHISEILDELGKRGYDVVVDD